MRWIDLLRMSSNSLKRRKLRTFLTVLGVVIGTASIVVMISLGLGLQETMYQEIEQSGGVTSLTVTGKDSMYGGMYMSDGSNSEEATKYTTDAVVEQIKQLEHVTDVQPVLEISALLKKNGYVGYCPLTGMTEEGLKNLNIKLAPGGRLPKAGSSELELVIGNNVITNFSEESTGKMYWETGVLPEIDLANESLFLILDEQAYYSAQSPSMGTSDPAGGGDANSQQNSGPPKKYVVHASGIVEGDIDTYNAHSYVVYCDLNTLKTMLKKEFRGRAIPGQPTTKSGKPYKDFVYTSLKVKADNIDNVDALSTEIRNMGFQVSTNVEYMNSMKKQFAMVQAVLGGIGAVSLFVAAIGIANTMMMSIYERTKEIGVIKVLGCSLRNIKQMFLLEAAFIGFIGGLIGNVLSYLLSFVINAVVAGSGALGMEGNISYIPFWLAAASMIFAVFVGMAAGYFPALRAMRLSPLAAIHNE